MSDNYQVRLLPVAAEDLDEIVAYVALDNLQAASRLADRIETRLGSLSSFPRLGRIPRDSDLRAAGYRYLIIGDYLAFFNRGEAHRHRAQDPPRHTRL